jgi:hypothetical protein
MIFRSGSLQPLTGALAMDMKDKFLADNDMLATPPVPCDYAVGDRVMYTNDAGIVFGPFRVIGFARNSSFGRFVHLDWESAWFAVRPEGLSPVLQTKPQRKTLQQRICEAFPYFTERDFSHHATDLYVVADPELIAWLRDNYEFCQNITTFVGAPGADWNGAGRQCLDIPFAHPVT